MTRTLPVTARTRLRRKPDRGTHDRAAIDAILDEALVCHVAFAADHGPVVLPTAHARVGDALYVHGSHGNQLLRALAAGAPCAIAVTLLDGLVLARTALHHSLNYRSVVLFGRAAPVEDEAEKRRALDALLEKLAPGRAAACRAPSPAELTGTLVLALPIAEASAKVRRGPPLPDEGEDAALPYWAGVIPIAATRGAPITAPDCAAPGPA